MIRRAWMLLVTALVVGASVAACDLVLVSPPDSYLGFGCFEDAECGDGLQCREGVCVIDGLVDCVDCEEDSPVACTTTDDCPDPDPARTRCDGFCRTICDGNDDLCPLDSFCNDDGVCAPGCRDSSTCAEGLVCNAGACVASTNECTSKCDCSAGEVCSLGACVPAAARCDSAADCPRGPGDRCEAFQCNGFTNQCFDPDPQPCTAATDCIGRPGCTGGAICTCTTAGTCVPDAACTPQDESTTCGSGNYCDDDARCQALPACATADDCGGAGLLCNPGSGFCERARACVDAADCTVAPLTFCDAGAGFCTIPSCTNGGAPCTDGLVCSDVTGRCVTPGGPSCTSDGNCVAGEYCDLVDQVCRVGCRSNADCAAGQSCDGSRTCVGSSSGTGQFQDPCTSPADCEAPMICGATSGTCAETCTVAEDCVACAAVHGVCNCDFLGFCRRQ